ncbi:ATP-binding cassette domain-containing protein [Vibrio ponticus]|uniref:ATP-binding cassette domain-containing protein n=1 Tax=Vibrio ponticus TaxID=265668 RepID=A0A3N3E223_9VIBR|nr:ATP-binding cassette domain-containing protein [Vibrio ponticus]ROV60726.1 ATP-binding cassette domain-containing protein [Vibrio ponticus]
MTLLLKDLTVYKPHQEALFQHLNLTIKPGEVVAVMGPSGCGKSTLLNAIAGHLSGDFELGGTLSLCGEPIDQTPPHLRKLGVLFQDDLLFPHLNVWQNLAFALPNDVPKALRKTHALECLQQVNLLDLATSYPEQISGGQRARVSLLRMLLAQPKAALLDEPFSKLDKALRAQFRDWVFEQLGAANVPTLLVTHDIDDVPPGAKILNWPWQATSNQTNNTNNSETDHAR